MTRETRQKNTAQGNSRNENPPRRSQRESVRGRGRSRGVRSTNVARIGEDHPPPVADEDVVQPLFTTASASPTPSSSNPRRDHPPDRRQSVAPTNLIRNTPFGEPFLPLQMPAPSQTSSHPTDPSPLQQTGPLSTPLHSSLQPLSPPRRSIQPRPTRTRRQIPKKHGKKPKGLAKEGLKKMMNLQTTTEQRNAYNHFRERVRFHMKRKGEGVWIDFDSVPKRLTDWLVEEVSTTIPLHTESLDDQVTNDPRVPFMNEYGPWAVLDAARRTAGSWRQGLYSKGLKEVPENRRYLAANSAKRNPNAPRGARFPARSSKHSQTQALDSNDDNANIHDHGDGNDRENDCEFTILPPGPSTTTDSVRFSNSGRVGWDTAPSSNYPNHPTSGISQLPFVNSRQPPQAQALWDPTCIPPSVTPSNVHYWANPPPSPLSSRYPCMQNDNHEPRANANGVMNQAPQQLFGLEDVGQGILPGYPSTWNDSRTPWPYGQQLNTNQGYSQARGPNNSEHVILHNPAPLPRQQFRFVQFAPGNGNVDDDGGSDGNGGYSSDSYDYSDSDDGYGDGGDDYGDGGDGYSYGDGDNGHRQKHGRRPPPEG